MSEKMLHLPVVTDRKPAYTLFHVNTKVKTNEHWTRVNRRTRC